MTKTMHDLGNDWLLTQWPDGTVDIHNPYEEKRITLPPASAAAARLLAMTLPAKARNWLALARSMNRKVWAKMPLTQEMQARLVTPEVVERMEANADRQQAQWLAEQRDRLVFNILLCVRDPGAFWRHVYIRPITPQPLTTDEAVERLETMLMHAKGINGFRARPAEAQAIREALAFVRYFRRYGSRVWSSHIEADRIARFIGERYRARA